MDVFKKENKKYALILRNNNSKIILGFYENRGIAENKMCNLESICLPITDYICSIIETGEIYKKVDDNFFRPKNFSNYIDNLEMSNGIFYKKLPNNHAVSVSDSNNPDVQYGLSLFSYLDLGDVELFFENSTQEEKEKYFNNILLNNNLKNENIFTEEGRKIRHDLNIPNDAKKVAPIFRSIFKGAESMLNVKEKKPAKRQICF